VPHGHELRQSGRRWRAAVMSAQCPYPTIRFVAYETRLNNMIFVPDPSLRGRYVLTDRCVALVPCPQCKSIPGEPCKGKQGYWASTHVVRRNAVWRKDKSGAADIVRKPRIKLLCGPQS
jgi:hypothetical protein